MSNAQQPAYPVNSSSYPARDGDYTVHETAGGLTKRELIAAMAMQGLLGSDLVLRHSDQVAEVTEEFHRGKWIARQATGFADALLAELERRDD